MLVSSNHRSFIVLVGVGKVDRSVDREVDSEDEREDRPTVEELHLDR